MFKAKLFKHQIEGVEFALSTPYHINGFEMGLGKTATALAVACKLKKKTLIVCPAYLKRNWEDEIEKFTDGSLDITISSYTQLKKVNFTASYGFIVADEAHYLKNIKAKRTQLFHELVQLIKPDNLMMLSGTPIKNRVSEFWSLLQLCYYGGRYESFKPYYKLYYKFCNKFSFERTFEVNNIPIVRFDGVRNVPQLKQLVSPVYLRKRTKDVIDLPEVTEIPIRSECKKSYETNLKAAFELFEQDHKDPAYMSMKRANALAKVKDTIKLAKDIIEQDDKVIIFTDHVASAEVIAKDLKCDLVTGKVSAEKRGEIVSNFQSGDSFAIVATIGSLSTGVNLTNANRMIFNDLPFVPTDLEQAKARIYRIGQEKKCFYYYVFNSEFDMKLKEMIARKNRDIKKVYE